MRIIRGPKRVDLRKQVKRTYRTAITDEYGDEYKVPEVIVKELTPLDGRWNVGVVMPQSQDPTVMALDRSSHDIYVVSFESKDDMESWLKEFDHFEVLAIA